MVAPSNFFSFIASSKVWMQTSSCDCCQPFLARFPGGRTPRKVQQSWEVSKLHWLTSRTLFFFDAFMDWIRNNPTCTPCILCQDCEPARSAPNKAMGFPGALNALELFLYPSSTNCINERAKGTVPGSSKSVKHDVLHTSLIPESKSKGGSMCLWARNESIPKAQRPYWYEYWSRKVGKVGRM